LILVNWS